MGCSEQSWRAYSVELYSPEMHPRTLNEIRESMKADPTLSVLSECVAQDWPSDKSHVRTTLLHYYQWRDELAVYHGVLYKSHKSSQTPDITV